jgi:hypothetical protein
MKTPIRKLDWKIKCIGRVNGGLEGMKTYNIPRYSCVKNSGRRVLDSNSESDYSVRNSSSFLLLMISTQHQLAMAT